MLWGCHKATYLEDELQIRTVQRRRQEYRDYRLRVQERRQRRGQSVYRPFHEEFDGIVGPTCLLFSTGIRNLEHTNGIGGAPQIKYYKHESNILETRILRCTLFLYFYVFECYSGFDFLECRVLSSEVSDFRFAVSEGGEDSVDWESSNFLH